MNEFDFRRLVAGALGLLVACGSSPHATTSTPRDSGSPESTGPGGLPQTNPCVEAGDCTAPVSCEALAAAVGTWQNISPPAFRDPANMETLAVAVNPEDETVYAAAGNVTNGSACPAGATCPSQGTGVLKSTDCGATWTLVTSKTPGSAAANLFTGDPWALLVDPVTPATMYIDNGYGSGPTLYKSTNAGVDWTALDPDPARVVGTGLPFVQAIAIDPFDHLHLAVTFHANCGSPFTPWCFSQSTDGGATWKEFNGPTSVPGFTIGGWMEAASISILGATSYVALSPGGVYFTGDGGTTWTLVLAEIDDTSYAGSTHVLPDGTLVLGNSAGPLYASAPAPGHSPPFAIYQAPSLPVPQPRLRFQTGLSPAVTPILNAPQGTQIVDDGVSIYASTSTSPPFWKAPLSDTTAWTRMPDAVCMNKVCRGSNEVAYDAVHHVIYSANWGAGLWRLVTR
ncbi:MAG TPA: sialidase family protein [Polyangiaceae bacterium]|nr:sialidase family protein [Polyangiaceae bacterium]